VLSLGAAMLACALILPASLAAAARQPAAATLEGCVTAVPQTERSATFSGEMTAVPGSQRMQMRIEVQERGPAEADFHTIGFPGLGVWLRATPGVHAFKNLQRVTDLTAPADYRAAIRFRWLGAHGRVLKVVELRTARCLQPAPPAARPGEPSTVIAGGTGTS
jgi:hypothetical protein